MSLKTLLQGMVEISPAEDVWIEDMTQDSRQVRAGSLFCALAGSNGRGHDYIADAKANGAVAIIADTGISELADLDIPIIELSGLRQRLGGLAARFYGEPSSGMTVVGITGTNGKTSVSRYLAQAMSDDHNSAVIGTLGNGILGKETTATHTTPDAISLQAILADLQQQEAEYVAMEVSSHGLDQGRVSGVRFDTTVFTNLSRDHLDYHGDMESYAAAKAELFRWPGLKHAVLNLDDPYSQVLIEHMSPDVEIVGYSLSPEYVETSYRQLRAIKVVTSSEQVIVDVDSSWGQGSFKTTLLGRFNISNALAVLATLLVQGVAFTEALSRMSRLTAVAGRMERFGGGELPLVVVDYAHTPDALQQVLSSLRDYVRGSLVCVFGCGGERDQGKRPQMAAIAEQYADTVVITNDNPRGESPESIINAIKSGLNNPAKAVIEMDRHVAIQQAIRSANKGDVVLVAGKGHEDYQIINGQMLHFDDREEAQLALSKMGEQG
ncbi:MAG: UDP-N-acetylmuramoyl-L-alanyl-D-glutamate--2,6-diaminopimelate ligase [Gammaproteobacteria bacterium]|nr:UDP-N-acetylmuramoyl-L-alanyl-D-glutamate--2,6-diaminopimelate ligase [Gammaproteobacteria bacterium]